MFDSAFGVGQWIIVLVALGVFAVFVVLLQGMAKTVKRKPAVAPLCMIFLYPLWIIWSIVELFTGEIEPETKTTKTEKMKYIGIWFLACIIYLILGLGNVFIFDDIFVEMIIHNSDYLSTFFIVFSVIDTLVFIGVFIFIYNIFSALNMKKVFPYLVVLHGLGTLKGIAETVRDLIDFDIGASLAAFSISEIISFFVAIYVIRVYYINKPDRWH